MKNLSDTWEIVNYQPLDACQQLDCIFDKMEACLGEKQSNKQFSSSAAYRAIVSKVKKNPSGSTLENYLKLARKYKYPK